MSHSVSLKSFSTKYTPHTSYLANEKEMRLQIYTCHHCRTSVPCHPAQNTECSVCLQHVCPYCSYQCAGTCTIVCWSHGGCKPLQYCAYCNDPLCGQCQRTCSECQKITVCDICSECQHPRRWRCDKCSHEMPPLYL